MYSTDKGWSEEPLVAQIQWRVNWQSRLSMTFSNNSVLTQLYNIAQSRSNQAFLSLVALTEGKTTKKTVLTSVLVLQQGRHEVRLQVHYSIFIQYFDVSNKIWCIKEESLLHLKLFIQHHLDASTLMSAGNIRVNKINTVPALI